MKGDINIATKVYYLGENYKIKSFAVGHIHNENGNLSFREKYSDNSEGLLYEKQLFTDCGECREEAEKNVRIQLQEALRSLNSEVAGSSSNAQAKLFRLKNYNKQVESFLWKDKYLDDEGVITYIDTSGDSLKASDVYSSVGSCREAGIKHWEEKTASRLKSIEDSFRELQS